MIGLWLCGRKSGGSNALSHTMCGFALGCVWCIGVVFWVVLVYDVLKVYFVNVLGPHGYEWSERYGTIAMCAGHRFLLTRMRHIGRHKYVPVLRIQGDPHAHVLRNSTASGFNPTIYCDDDVLYLMGSASVEWPSSVETSNPKVYVTPLYPVRGPPRVADFDLSTCVDEYFDRCALDGKFSVVRRRDTWYAYIRANMSPTGGGRFVQVATRHKQDPRWSAFRLLKMDDVVLRPQTNIYTFDVHVDEKVEDLPFKARFPAVLESMGGIYESRSHDGFHWSAPSLTMHVPSKGPRIDMHPVGQHHVMSINLQLDLHAVSLRRFANERRIETLIHDYSFFTNLIRT